MIEPFEEKRSLTCIRFVKPHRMVTLPGAQGRDCCPCVDAALGELQNESFATSTNRRGQAEPAMHRRTIWVQVPALAKPGNLLGQRIDPAPPTSRTTTHDVLNEFCWYGNQCTHRTFCGDGDFGATHLRLMLVSGDVRERGKRPFAHRP